MSTGDSALDTQLGNIQKKTGRSLDELTRTIIESDLTKHGEMRTFAMEELGLGYGDANTLVHYARKAAEGDALGNGEPSVEEAVATIYSGKKAELLPIHQEFMASIVKLTEFEIAPKKVYLSLRRKKQFATVGPGSKGRVEIGVNPIDPETSSRLEKMPPGSMCKYRVFLSEPSEVDDELFAWVNSSYESSG